MATDGRTTKCPATAAGIGPLRCRQPSAATPRARRPLGAARDVEVDVADDEDSSRLVDPSPFGRPASSPMVSANSSRARAAGVSLAVPPAAPETFLRFASDAVRPARPKPRHLVNTVQDLSAPRRGPAGARCPGRADRHHDRAARARGRRKRPVEARGLEARRSRTVASKTRAHHHPGVRHRSAGKTRHRRREVDRRPVAPRTILASTGHGGPRRGALRDGALALARDAWCIILDDDHEAAHAAARDVAVHKRRGTHQAGRGAGERPESATALGVDLATNPPRKIV